MRSCAYSPLLLAGTVAGMALTYLAPAAARALRARPGALARACGLGCDGAVLSCRRCASIACRRCGASRCRPSPRSIWLYTLDSAYQHCARPRRPMEGARARQRAEPAMTAQRDIAIRQGPSRREFPRRLVADQGAASRRPSSRSMNSCASPTTSPTMRASRRTKSSRCSIGSKRTLLGANDDEPQGVALRAVLARARAFAAACAGSAAARSGMDVTKLRYRRLGRSDRLLPLLGDAGRPFRARRAWREPRRPGRPTTRSAPRCRSSIICRTAARTTATSTASTCRSTRWPRTAPRSKRWARRRPRRRCARCIDALAEPHRRAARREPPVRRSWSRTARLALEIAAIQALAERLIGALLTRAIR